MPKLPRIKKVLSEIPQSRASDGVLGRRGSRNSIAMIMDHDHTVNGQFIGMSKDNLPPISWGRTNFLFMIPFGNTALEERSDLRSFGRISQTFIREQKLDDTLSTVTSKDPERI